MTRKISPEHRALRQAIKAQPPLTDEDEARIQAGIAQDPDNPELTEEEMATAKPFREVFPDLYANIKRTRGRPKLDAPRQPVTLRLSPEAIARFKASGGERWRARMSEALESVAPSPVDDAPGLSTPEGIKRFKSAPATRGRPKLTRKIAP